MQRHTIQIFKMSPIDYLSCFRRTISNNPRIIKSQVLRKVKKQIDRFPSQGEDPALSFKHGWRLASAAMLERYPVIIPNQHEFEYQYLKDRFLAEQLQSRPMPKEMFLSERDIIEGKKEPTFKDAIVAQQYIPGSRITKADEQNDTKSLQRALSERLYFLIKSKQQQQQQRNLYRFPQTIATDQSIPLWTYAENSFKAVTHPQSRPLIHFVSPRPACHIQHVFPISYQKKHDVYGVKVFFYRAVLVSGQIEQVRNAVDYIWARESELPQLVGEEYYKQIKPALFGVGPSNNYDV